MSLEAVLSDQSMDFHNFAPRSGLAFVLSPPLRSVHSRIEINDSSSVVLELMGESEQTVDSEFPFSFSLLNVELLNTSRFSSTVLQYPLSSHSDRKMLQGLLHDCSNYRKR